MKEAIRDLVCVCRHHHPPTREISKTNDACRRRQPKVALAAARSTRGARGAVEGPRERGRVEKLVEGRGAGFDCSVMRALMLDEIVVAFSPGRTWVNPRAPMVVPMVVCDIPTVTFRIRLQ